MTTSITPEQATESNATARQPNYQRMFEAACVALGEVGDALGCDPNEGGSEPILDAIQSLIAERDVFRVHAELYRHLRDHFAKTATDAKAEFARLEPLTGAQFDAVVRASIDAMGAAS